MKIKDEFKLINELTDDFMKYQSDLKAGVGEDVAVIKQNDGFLLATTDALVENDHFNVEWSTPEQIGKKAVEVNVSDIASTGGRPTYLLASLVLRKATAEKWIKGVYRGMKRACDKYKITLAGGDTTHGEINVISVALLGKTKRPILRSGAKTGDLICVTGQVGGSSAGLNKLLTKKKMPSILKKKHLEPVARLDVSGNIAKCANSMIDVSDGVASEIRHLCEQSQKGAMVRLDGIPLCPGATLRDALSGGEDFELLFTVPKKDRVKLKNVDFTVIGEIKNQNFGIRPDLPGGFDHFANN